MFNTLTTAILACGIAGNTQTEVPKNQSIEMPIVASYEVRMSQDEVTCVMNEIDAYMKECLRLEQERLDEEKRQAEAEAIRKASIIMSYNTSSDITKKSNLSSEELEKVFYDTGLAGLGAYFIEVEEEYGVNAVFLSSIAILESGWGNSTYAKERNNLFGFQANDDNPNKATRFSSKYDAIVHVAKHLSSNYLNQDGVYYNGSTPKGVNVMYCTSSDWSSKVVEIMNRVVSKATS